MNRQAPSYRRMVWLAEGLAFFEGAVASAPAPPSSAQDVVAACVCNEFLLARMAEPEHG